MSYMYNGQQYTNYTGNYWGDYTGPDNNGDGIGDVSYPVSGGDFDYYPMLGGSNSYSISLKEGWNLVSFPVVNYSISASSLEDIGVTDVARYNNVAKVFDIYMVGISPPEYDFSLRTDDGYFIKCSHDTTLVVLGDTPGVRSLPLCAGWNIVGWSNFTGSDAMTVSGALASVTDIARYNTTTHDFDIYMVGVSPDDYNFAMGDGEGYFVKTSNNMIFPYGGY